MTSLAFPLVIQGGMGIAVSNWSLARAVSAHGQLGVISGTAIDTVFVRRLQDGDVGGAVRRALEHFPMPDVANEILKRYFNPNGRAEGEPYKLLPMYRQTVSRIREQVTIAANFVEVFLAKEGHGGKVGINLLTKVQMPNLASLYGAMLARVDVVLMGAGIPREIPGSLDRLSVHDEASLKFDVEGVKSEITEYLRFNPRNHWNPESDLKRPDFYAIVSAHSLATTLARKANGSVEGFVVEASTAGGHNAPPRGAMQLNERGEPIYGERDVANLEAMKELGTPFWLAGGSGTPEGLQLALDAGAKGIQVGTPFAYCDESGFTPETKRKVLEQLAHGNVGVFTDPLASPTGFPFKVLEGVDIEQQNDTRTRICDLGYLRIAARREDGRIVYRCPAAPIKEYLNSGGQMEETVGRRCLCNGLVAAIGLPQKREEGKFEAPYITSGDSVADLGRIARGRLSYTASDVLEYILGQKSCTQSIEFQGVEVGAEGSAA